MSDYYRQLPHISLYLEDISTKNSLLNQVQGQLSLKPLHKVNYNFIQQDTILILLNGFSVLFLVQENVLTFFVSGNWTQVQNIVIFLWN